ncbi:MAG: hypothetical protein KDJ65_33220 [Anaerolineae bacterium]|nr:hypothetical protein [Anaerolineae bacterium]
MNQNLTTQIAQLLAQAGSAHHQFEQTVLKGAYDEAWPDWYADYLLAHNLNDLLPEPVSLTELSQFLLQSNETRIQQLPEPDWADYTAHDLVTRFADTS